MSGPEHGQGALVLMLVDTGPIYLRLAAKQLD